MFSCFALCVLSHSFLRTVCSKVSDSLMLATCILFCSCLCKVCSRVSDVLWQALCNLPLAFLVDFTLSDSIALINYALLFVWIKRHDHSVHMSSVLQVQQLYTAGIPLLEAYLLPMTNNRTRKERLSHASENKMATSNVVQIHMYARFPWSTEWPTYVAVPTGNTLALQWGVFSENCLKFSIFIRRCEGCYC